MKYISNRRKEESEIKEKSHPKLFLIGEKKERKKMRLSKDLLSIISEAVSEESCPIHDLPLPAFQ